MLEYKRVKLRKFKWDDLYAVQALINTIAGDECDPFFYNLEWLHYVLSQPGVYPESNCFVATVYGGRLIGYSRLESGDDVTQKTVFAGTHPNMQGIGVGRALIAVSDFNLMAIHPSDTPLSVMRHTSKDHIRSKQLLNYVGYTHAGYDNENRSLWEKQLR